MQLTIHHRLAFTVAAGVPRSVTHVLLTPVSGPTQTVRDWSVTMPGISEAARFQDAYGNRAMLIGQNRPEGEVVVLVEGTVETVDRNGVVGRPPGEPVIALYSRITPLTKPDARFVEPFVGAKRFGAARIALFHEVMERIGEALRFEPGVLLSKADAPAAKQEQAQGGDGQAQTQVQPAAAESDASAGPDGRQAADAPAFAHAFIATLRGLDIPARYVTGYLAPSADWPAAFHAWAEAWDDALGWIGFDAALGICPTDRHVRVASGLDMLSTLPLRMVPSLPTMPTETVSIEAA